MRDGTPGNIKYEEFFFLNRVRGSPHRFQSRKFIHKPGEEQV